MDQNDENFDVDTVIKIEPNIYDSALVSHSEGEGEPIFPIEVDQILIKKYDIGIKEEDNNEDKEDSDEWLPTKLANKSRKKRYKRASKRPASRVDGRENERERKPPSKSKRKNFKVDLRTHGMCLSIENELSWECRKCKNKQSFDTLVKFISHALREHSNTFNSKCNICCEVVKASALDEHFNDKHANMNISFYQGRNKEGNGHVVPERDLNAFDDDCQFENGSPEPAGDDEPEFDDFDDLPLDVLINSETKKPPANDDSRDLKIKCEHCPDVFDTVSNYDQHLKDDHQLDESKILEKREEINKDASAASTPKAEKKKEKHLCTHCGKTFNLFYLRNVHNCREDIDKKKGEKVAPVRHEKHLCFKCGKKFNYFYLKKRHDCSKRKTYTKRNKNKRKGEQDEDGPEVHLCSTCGKTFHLEYLLKVHLRSHLDDKPYKCTYCGKGHTICSNLKRHLLTHTGERPYLCKICGKTYTQSSRLKIHSMKAHGTKPTLMRALRCDHCDKEFASRSALRDHINVHTGARPYICPQCPKTFASQNIFSRHVSMMHKVPSFEVYRTF